MLKDVLVLLHRSQNAQVGINFTMYITQHAQVGIRFIMYITYDAQVSVSFIVNTGCSSRYQVHCVFHT